MANFKTYNSSSRDRKVMEVSNFGGVDLSNPALLVSDSRATNMLNFIKKDNVNQKRKGWEQVLNLENQNINGVWTFIAEDNEEHTIAHINDSLYMIEGLGKDKTFAEIILSQMSGDYSLLNQKTQAFVSGKRLYILGGIDYLMVRYSEIGVPEVVKVKDSKYTYVPLTTRGITHNSSTLSIKRSSYDDVNLMSTKRKNSLYTGVLESETQKEYSFTLDGRVKTPTSTIIEVEQAIITYGQKTEEMLRVGKNIGGETLILNTNIINYLDFDLDVKYEIVANNGDKIVLSSYEGTHNNINDVIGYTISYIKSGEEIGQTYLDLVLVLDSEGTFNGNAIFHRDSKRMTLPESFVISEIDEGIKDFVMLDTQVSGSRSELFEVDENNAIKQYGNIEVGYLKTTGNSTEVVFKEKFLPIPAIEGQDNVVVTFDFETTDYEFINKATFGILYGATNNRNRLFVSGNPNYPNLDWHTSPINVATTSKYEGIAESDLTYFSDLSQQAYGQTSNKVIGYDILGNGVLMVLKTHSTQEPTIYYREAKYTYATSYDGSKVLDENGNELYEEEYPLVVGNIGYGGLSPFGFANFNGDTLFMTSSGLKGLDVSTNISNNQRYANNRSSLIDKQLITETLQESSLHIFKDYLFINNPNQNHSYVANLNYRAGNEYEWWVIDTKANLMFEYDDELYFANGKGLFKFNYIEDYTNYVDKTIKQVDDFRYSNYYIYDIDTTGYDEISFYSENEGKTIYHYIGDISYISQDKKTFIVTILNSESQKVHLSDDEFNFLLYEGQEVYISDNRKKFIVSLKDIDGNDLPKNYIRFTNMESNEWKSEGKILLSIDKPLKILEQNDNDYVNIKIGEYNGVDIPLRLYALDSEEGFEHLRVSLIKNTPVSAYYVTKPYSLGSNIQNKNILSWTIINDTNLKSSCEIGYYSNSGSNYSVLQMQKEGEILSFEKFDFDRFSFLQNYLPHNYTKWKSLRNISNIMFAFKNETNSNCVLTNLTILYTIGAFKRGGR